MVYIVFIVYNTFKMLDVTHWDTDSQSQTAVLWLARLSLPTYEVRSAVFLLGMQCHWGLWNPGFDLGPYMCACMLPCRHAWLDSLTRHRRRLAYSHFPVQLPYNHAAQSCGRAVCPRAPEPRAWEVTRKRGQEPDWSYSSGQARSWATRSWVRGFMGDALNRVEATTVLYLYELYYVLYYTVLYFTVLWCNVP